jgi:hypothetical protein
MQSLFGCLDGHGGCARQSNATQGAILVTAFVRCIGTFTLNVRTMKKENCKHYFILEEPNGPIAKGVCKHCDTVQEHYNAFIPRTKIRRISKKENGDDIYASVADFKI